MAEKNNTLNPVTSEECTDTQAAIAAGQRLGHLETGVSTGTFEGIPYIAHSSLLHVNVRDDLLDKPKRLKLDLKMNEPDSFIGFLNKFKLPGTVIRRELNSNRFWAILDHSTPEENAWHDRTIVLDLQRTEDLNLWAEAAMKTLTHMELLRLLQDMLHTILKPDAGVILKAAKTFSATRAVTINRVVPAEGGDASFHFSDEVRGNTKDGEAVFPSRLTLRLPLFLFCDPVDLDVNVNWTLDREGGVQFSLSILRLEEAIQKQLYSVRCKIEKETELAVWM